MSEYRQIELEVRDLAVLVEALKALFGEAAVETGEGLPLYGYEGRVRRRDALVRVDRRHIGPGANDLGVVRGRAGYELVYSEYDLRVRGGLVGRIKQEYGVRLALKTARLRGRRAVREDLPDGRVVVRISL